jgi:hypothetical protein
MNLHRVLTWKDVRPLLLRLIAFRSEKKTINDLGTSHNAGATHIDPRFGSSIMSGKTQLMGHRFCKLLSIQWSEAFVILPKKTIKIACDAR